MSKALTNQKPKPTQFPNLTLWFAVALAVVYAAIGWRVYSTYQSPQQLDSGREGYCDFHNGVYFPSLAFRQGVSPYGREFQEKYPIVRPMALYGPAIFAIHLPFTSLDLPAADVAHYGFQILCTLALAALCLHSVPRQQRWQVGLAMACIIAASRSGYGTLVTGYFTLVLVIGTVVAWQPHWPVWMRAIGYALAACKPTYAIPLSLLLLARRQYRTLGMGLLVFGVANGAAVGWLLLQPGASPEQLLADLREGQSQHVADPNEFPVNSWTRVDLLAIVAKWIDWRPSEWQHVVWMLPLIAGPMWLLWQESRVKRTDRMPEIDTLGSSATKQGPVSSSMECPLEGADQKNNLRPIDWKRRATDHWAELVAMLALVVTVYHHYYDLLVVVPGLCGIIVTGWFARFGNLTGKPEQLHAVVPRQPKDSGTTNRLSLVVIALILASLFHYGSAKFVLVKLDPSPMMYGVLTSLNGFALSLALGISCWILRSKMK